MLDLGIFELGFENNIVVFEISTRSTPPPTHPRQICLIPKFGVENKISKFEIKNGLFGYFWLKMSDLGIFRKEF